MKAQHYYTMFFSTGDNPEDLYFSIIPKKADPKEQKASIKKYFTDIVVSKIKQQEGDAPKRTKEFVMFLKAGKKVETPNPIPINWDDVDTEVEISKIDATSVTDQILYIFEQTKDYTHTLAELKNIRAESFDFTRGAFKELDDEQKKAFAQALEIKLQEATKEIKEGYSLGRIGTVTCVVVLVGGAFYLFYKKQQQESDPLYQLVNME